MAALLVAIPALASEGWVSVKGGAVRPGVRVDGFEMPDPFPSGWQPVSWSGGAVRDLMTADGAKLGRFTGKGVERSDAKPPWPEGKASCRMAADLAGDYRDEVVCVDERGVSEWEP